MRRNENIDKVCGVVECVIKCQVVKIVFDEGYDEENYILFWKVENVRFIIRIKVIFGIWK